MPPAFLNSAFLDIDTQIDFVFPSGALYVPGAVRIIPTVASLNRHAMSRAIPLISTVCAHSENDPEFQTWPPHCILGTVGQQKPAALLVGQRLFEKQHTDLFLSPDAGPLIADFVSFIVYGVATEVCVLAAAFGLLARGKRVSVVQDAVTGIDPGLVSSFFEELRQRGGHIVTANSLLESA